MMMNDVADFLWVAKYRPRKIADTILPVEMKTTFQEFVSQGNIPNLLLSGRAGIGKTTVARAMLDEIGADYLIINGSNEGRSIEVLRVDIANFASTVSFAGGRKYIILDEADGLGAAVQAALRNFMEEFSSNCGFILTCNFKNKIIEPLRSRCSVIDFTIPPAQKAKIAAQFFKRTCHILETEGVKYDPKTVAELIQTHFPDWRRTLNELQRYSATGSIDSGILRNLGAENIVSLIDFLKKKNFDGMRKWVSENLDMEASVLYRHLYDVLPTQIKSSSGVATAVIILAEYQFKEAFVADTEVNRVAALASLMAEIDFK